MAFQSRFVARAAYGKRQRVAIGFIQDCHFFTVGRRRGAAPNLRDESQLVTRQGRVGRRDVLELISFHFIPFYERRNAVFIN